MPTQQQLDGVAASLRQLADVLSPATTTAPKPTTPPPIDPAKSFEGRSALNSQVWKQVFEDDFTVLAPEGTFLKKYPSWDAYPDEYPVTDKNGYYEPNNISVIDIGDRRVMNCALKPGSPTTKAQLPSSAAPHPRFPGQNDASASKGMRVEMRVRITKPVAGWHCANLLWPDSEQWPRDGEIDFYEFDFPSSIGCFMHRQDGTHGGDQDGFITHARPTEWHIIAFEWVTGRSFKWFVDGRQVGDTITTRVPATPMHLVLQNESSGKPLEASAVQYDWISIAIPR
jgi:hypothetical protein